jgi:hypothetical protein
MADDNTVQIKFGASTEELLAAVGLVRAALSGLTEPIIGLAADFKHLGDSLNADQVNQAAKAVGDIGAAARSAAGGVYSITTQLRLMQIAQGEQRTLLNADVSQFKITQDQKFSILEAELNKEYAAEQELLYQKLSSAESYSDEWKRIQDRITIAAAKHDADMVRLNEQSIAAQQALWTGYLSSVTSAFNSQLRGLLEGTTTWHKAMIKMLEDLTIKFIEAAEQMVVKWLAAEIAKTTATQAQTATRTAAETTASSSGILANVANAVQTILTDAAQAFAGVFAFLAPTMGPAAAGPAAAAQATVSAAAIFAEGTDYVVRGGLALIHPGETIIPAARGLGPYTGAGPGGGGRAPNGDIHLNISAMDSRSIVRFFNDNDGAIMKALRQALRRGGSLQLAR